MAFKSEVVLSVITTQAERQIRKVERNIEKIEDASRDILAIDKQIVRERQKLLTLSGTDAKNANKKVQSLRLQRQELSLQKRELTDINRLEKKRAQAYGAPSSGGDGGGINPLALAGAGAAAAARMTPKQIFKQGSLVGELKLDRARVADAFDATVDEIQDGEAKVRAALEKYRKTVGKFGGGSPQAAMSRNVGVRPKIDALRDSKAAAAYGQGRLRDIDTTIESIEAAQQKLNAAASRGSGVMGSLAKSLLLTAGAYISVEAAARQAITSIQKSIAAASSEQRIRALADGFDNYEAVLFRASAAAEKFNISQIEANNQFAQLYGRLRPLGLTLSEINTVFEGFNTAAALTGATASESAGALLQLSQALGAGALRGEEFNSIAEQAPAVLQAIAKEIDAPVGQLKGLAKEGKITSDVVVAALSRVKRDGADKLANALDTPAQKVKKLANRFEDLQVALGELTLPTVIGLIEELTRVVTTGTEKIELYTRALNKLLEPLGILKIDVPLLTEAFSKLPGEIIKSIPGLGQIIRALETIDFLAQRIAGPKPEASKPPTVEDPTKPLRERLGLDDDTTTTTTSVEDTLKRQLEAGQDLSREFSRQLQLLQATEGLERKLLEIRFEEEDRMRAIADAAADQRDELTALSKDLAAAQAGTAIGEALGQDLVEMAESLRTAMEDAQSEFNQFFADNASEDLFGQAFEDSAAAAAQALEQTIGATLGSLIQGTDDLGEKLQNIASSLLTQVGSILFRAGMSGLGVPGFADGGFIGPNRVGLVGEEGPELIKAGPQGATVTSNEETMAAMSRYSPSNQQMAPVGGPIDVSYNVTEINSMRFVTEDQMLASSRQAAAQGAKQGEQRALNRLRQSRSTRSKLGM